MTIPFPLELLEREPIGPQAKDVSDEANCNGLPFAINCAALPSDLPKTVRDFLSTSLSAATKRAYASDLAHFQRWGGALPASPAIIAQYLAEMAATEKPATLARRIASLAKCHQALGATDPTKSELVRGTMRGIRRSLGTAQRQARPLLKDDLFATLDAMGDRVKDKRDRALLLVGFAGAFRRSELVALDVADIEHVREGIVITIRRSKTDQAGAGRKIGIPLGRQRWCPVKHLADWLECAEIREGPLLRSMNRHDAILDQRLSGEAVSIIVKQRAKTAGFDPAQYSGHSLRAGWATSAAMSGASTWKIRQQTGHASETMLSRYIRVGDLFIDNAASCVL